MNAKLIHTEQYNITYIYALLVCIPNCKTEFGYILYNLRNSENFKKINKRINKNGIKVSKNILIPIKINCFKNAYLTWYIIIILIFKSTKYHRLSE